MTAAAAACTCLQIASWQCGGGLVLWTLSSLFECDLRKYALDLHANVPRLIPSPRAFRKVPLLPMLLIIQDVSGDASAGGWQPV
jgi:hypothetical protein